MKRSTKLLILAFGLLFTTKDRRSLALWLKEAKCFWSYHGGLQKKLIADVYNLLGS